MRSPPISGVSWAPHAYAERGRSESESSSESMETDCGCFLERFLERVFAAFLPMVTVDVGRFQSLGPFFNGLEVNPSKPK